MSVTSVHKDPETSSMTVTAAFDAPVERVWQVWADPRQLERWWGPPTWPATVTHHELSPGGRVAYFMTGPDGERAHGWWRILAVDPPHRLEFEDGFALESGEPDPAMPTMTIRVSLHGEAGGGARMVIETAFPSREAMEQLIAMGMEEGMAAALGQVDDLLATGATAR